VGGEGPFYQYEEKIPQIEIISDPITKKGPFKAIFWKDRKPSAFGVSKDIFTE